MGQQAWVLVLQLLHALECRWLVTFSASVPFMKDRQGFGELT